MTAITYIRVSTDEQADKGYSLADQQSQLDQYCERKDITILKRFKEDYSAKTFERPEFTKLLQFIKQHKGEVNKLLVVKWDRFSRNMENSLNMITLLLKSGVEVEAIEQPLDNSVPENLIMKALYLVTPQVENLRRSMNTKNGMFSAMEQGRYCSMAPKGYKNATGEDKKPIIIPDPKYAHLIKEMFELTATGLYSQNETRLALNRKGLKMTRTRFAALIRNPIYIGKIQIPSHRGQPSKIVNGIHEPLISEELFYRVQDVVTGRSRAVKRQNKFREEFLLKGLVYCHGHDQKMTASCSKGRSALYHYYHCKHNCERHQADRLNEKFVSNYLTGIQELINSVDPELIEYYQASVAKAIKPKAGQTSTIQTQIQENEKRLINLQDDLVDRKISAEDFNQMKARYTATIFRLKESLNSMKEAESEFALNFENSVRLLTNLPDFYNQAAPEVKLKTAGLITVGKFYFDGENVRTAKTNSLVDLLTTLDKGFNPSSILKLDRYDTPVPCGDPSYAVVRTIIEDSKQLSNLLKLVA